MSPDSICHAFVGRPSCWYGRCFKIVFVFPIILLLWGCAGVSAGKSVISTGTTPTISLSPAAVALPSGAQQQYAVSVTNTSNLAITWSANQGTITQTGLYTAPTVSTSTTVTVTATSVSDTSAHANATVTVTPLASATVSLSPPAASLHPGGQLQFSANVSNANNNAVTWAVSKGTITSAGLFTAPTVSSTTTVNVTVTSVADASAHAAASVTITPISNLAIGTGSLANATEGAGYSQTITASGGTQPYAWSIVSGTMPAGIQLNNVSGAVTGTTGESGPFTFTVQVTDASSPQQIASAPMGLSVLTSGVQRITPQFFGMHINRRGVYPMPTIPFGGYRTIDSYYTLWNGIEKSPGVYDFTTLDSRLADAQAANVDVLYTIYSTPTFHSSNPTDTVCGTGNGACDPPGDINADGSGTDASLIAFLTALVNHVGTKIAYYEVWNECNILSEYTGTWPQLLRMAQDARSTILAANPSAKILSPSFAELTYASAAAKEVAYLTTSLNGSTGSDAADIINFHGYVVTPALPVPIPEYEVTNLINLQAAMKKAGDTADMAKPIWDGEWGPGSGLNDADLNSAFIARHMLIEAGQNIARTYYYDWNSNDQRALWSETLTDCLNGGIQNSSGYLCETGTAFQQVENWLLGNTAVAPCSGAMPPSTGVWTCSLLLPNGAQTLAVWDTSKTCAGGNCTTSNYSYPPRYTQFFTLANGVATPLTGGTVAIGAKPILLSP